MIIENVKSKYKNSATDDPQTTLEDSITGSVKLESANTASEESESDWHCDMDQLNWQYNVRGVPEPAKIFESFPFIKNGILP